MKLLLDENLPVKLKYRFIDNAMDAYTVRDMRWLGKENGELLSLMLENSFTTFLTIDNNLSFQQNFKKYPLNVVIIIALDNTYETIMQIFPNILNAVNSTNKISVVIHPEHSS